MSLRSQFHTTEDLLIERAQLHGLVDFFWQQLSHTRDEVYQRISTILCIADAHISDLTSEQIKTVAEDFQEALADKAPCHSCKYGHKTSYGLYKCVHKDGCGAFWNKPENALAERCPLYVSGHIPSQE